MTYIARNDQSIVGQWWNEIDQTLLWHSGGHYLDGSSCTGSVQTALA